MNWIAPKDTALVIVDVQNDFCPGGKLAVPDGDKIIPVVNELIQHFPVRVYTQDFHPEGHASFASSHEEKQPYDTVEMPYGTQTLWPDHCVQGTDGVGFHSDLDMGRDPLILQKGKNPQVDSYSGFFENDKKTRPVFANGKTLTDFFKESGIRRVVISGLAYDFCVGWHATDAKNEGFEVVVAKNATRSIGLRVVYPNGEMTNTDADMDKKLQEANVTILDSADLQDFLNTASDSPKLGL